MRIVQRALPPVLVLAVLGGCEKNNQISQYRVRVHCTLTDGTAASGITIARAGEPARESDAQGDVLLHLEGREGQEIQFEIAKLPTTLMLAEGSPIRKLVLKKLGDKRAVVEILHEVHLRPKKESYVVLVSAAQAPMLAVAANGSEVARLNSRSAAAFRLAGKPGDELKVTILASKDAKTPGSDPTQSFTLPEKSGILSFHSNLFIKPVFRKPTVAKSTVNIVPWGGGKRQ